MCNLSHFDLHHLKDIIGCIRGCYHGNPSPFSIDLIQAVSRQHEFNQKAIQVVNWQIPFGIARGIRQYHKFLGLMKRHPGQTLVPTLEIGMGHVILYDWMTLTTMFTKILHGIHTCCIHKHIEHSP